MTVKYCENHSCDWQFFVCI